MFYRESGQLKSSYIADQAMFPIAQDRWFVVGVLALALGRELTPVVTCIIIAGRVGSAFAAELGSQQVSEQTDSLRVLGSDPVDYLITPRVLASMIAAPVLNLLCFTMGMAASVFLAEAVYGVSANVILDSASRAIESWDIIVSMIKAWVCVLLPVSF